MFCKFYITYLLIISFTAATSARPKKPKNPTNAVDGGPSPNIDSSLSAGSDIANGECCESH